MTDAYLVSLAGAHEHSKLATLDRSAAASAPDHTQLLLEVGALPAN